MLTLLLAALAAPAETVTPFLTTYCVRCHDAKTKSGELDLTRPLNVLDDFRQWQTVVSFLKKDEMPPATAKQPPPAVRAEVIATLEGLLLAEARKQAGDPGAVPPRRLSNAEYDATVADLIGHDVRPARSFPADPASGEGFDNTGEALSMSPSLFKKYLAAAEHVAEHAVLTTQGVRFAPHPAVSFADRQKYAEQAILRFYEAHAADPAAHLASLWAYKHRPEASKSTAVEAWATAAKLSPKYARLLWDALEGEAMDEEPIRWLRGRWERAAAGDVRSLAAEAVRRGRELCVPETPAIVANAGNGPIEHLARRRRTAESRDVPARGDAVAFCRLFPNRFFYVDSTRGLSAGFHLVEGFFRDDRPLCRSALSDAENKELDRLWTELLFVTGIWEKMLRGFVFFERSERNFLKHADFDPFREEDPDLVKDETLARFQEVYLSRARVKLSGDALAKHPITVFFRDVREGLKWRAATLAGAEAAYRDDLLAFAERAYRRPLTAEERKKLTAFYDATCRDKEHGVEAAVRATIVRVLASPHFSLRVTTPPPGDTVAPLPDLDLASRLSYFLHSGPPDEELLSLAKAGKLRETATLREQTRRMARDPKVGRFAHQFFGQWLGSRDFLTQEAVDRAAFPAFDDALKQAMAEEPTRLITHLIQTGGPVTHLLDGDATFVNARLARHYGLPAPAEGWQRVTGLREKGRGGLLGMAVFLTKNSQPQRTSPVKRGFWVVHKLLGEHIPPPPPDVAVLPAKETAGRLTARELLKAHVEDAKCARCHVRFDPVGLAMEGFDPIGRARAKDLAGRPIDDLVSLPDGKEARGVPAFAADLARRRGGDFTRTLRHKLLGYALGRSLQLSDGPLLDEMQTALEKNGHALGALFEAVVISPQFRNQRCREFSLVKFRGDR